MDGGDQHMSLSFAHAMVQVRDLDKAIAFYTRELGLTLAERHSYEGADLAYLRCGKGGPEIELLSERPWRFAAVPEKGRTHIAFTVADADAEHRRLTALGVPCSGVGPYHANGKLQTRFFYLYDPDGNEIEILEAMGRYSQRGERA
jgi:catechol 2,3-dioxygenase-like lactoylglutathione lyase family enzyme